MEAKGEGRGLWELKYVAYFLEGVEAGPQIDILDLKCTLKVQMG